MHPIKNIFNNTFVIVTGLFLCISHATGLGAQKSNEKPNIVWLVTEDNSKHYLKLYDPAGAPMPHIESLAQNGIVFNHAFSQGPVCSVARSTLISGCYAPRIGAQYHRKMKKAPMPEGLEMFPFYLREAGYYTTNNSKEDYNLIKSDAVWDESSRKATFQNRMPGQPFFHVQNFGITHEGRLHFSAEGMSKNPTVFQASQMRPFPYHPNTPTFRYTNAWYRDLHQKADDEMGKFISQLDNQGLLENTIIFYYGDHGGVLPRSKGYIYESGIHVPLVVYVPEKWQHLVPLARGSRTDAFVQFMDFGPTVLNLAGVEIPAQMDGVPFLGKGVTKRDLESRNQAFSYADRFDEKYDLVRAIRRDNFKYLRSYQPFNMDALFNFYRYKMLAYQEWQKLFDQGSLDRNQNQFFLPRAPEALYDLKNDPHELNNLAADPDYRQVLHELRKELQHQVKSMPDLSFFPETVLIEDAIANPVQYGQAHRQEISELIDIADLSLLSFSKAKKRIKKALKSDNPWKRYWGLIVCSTFGKKASNFVKKAEKMADEDPNNLVRIRAIEFLGLSGIHVEERDILDLIRNANSETEANLMLNSVALLKTVNSGFQGQLNPNDFNPDWVKRENSLVNQRIKFLNR